VCPGDGACIRPATLIAVLQDDGNVAMYVHIMRNSARVSEGDVVACGDPLAKMGSAGDSSGPHLHFQMRQPHHPDYFTLTGFGPGSTLPDDFWRNGTRSRVIDPYDSGLWNLNSNNVPRVTCDSQRVRDSAANGTWVVNRAGVLGGAEYDSCGSLGNICGLGTFCHPERKVCLKRRNLGDACNQVHIAECGQGACIDRVCQRRGIGPGGRCGPNETCGPGLACSGGACTLQATVNTNNAVGAQPAQTCSAKFVDLNPAASGTQYACCAHNWRGQCTKVSYTCNRCGSNLGGCIDKSKGQGDINAQCGVR